MTAATWHALSSSGAIADLSSGVRLRLSGPDALRYLNGQVTNDVRKLRPGHALPACLTNHKGKLEAFVHLTLAPDGALLISADGDLRDFLPLRLEKYLIADDCVLEDVTETTTLLHLLAAAEQIASLLVDGEHPAVTNRFSLPASAPTEPAPSHGNAGSDRPLFQGHDLWTTPDRLPFWLSRFPVLSAEDQSTLEVLHGIPAWGHELTQGLLPPEAGLDATAIDYHKGCYIGQEVISRIRSVGRVNRLLTPLIQTSGPPLQPGWTVFSPAPDGTPAPAGTLTRTADHPLTGQRHALAFLRRGISGPLRSGPDATAAEAQIDVRKTLDD